MILDDLSGMQLSGNKTRKLQVLTLGGQVASGAGSYTNPQTRPAKTAVVANAAQLQSSGGPLQSSPPKPVDQTWTKTKPARPANL